MQSDWEVSTKISAGLMLKKLSHIWNDYRIWIKNSLISFLSVSISSLLYCKRFRRGGSSANRTSLLSCLFLFLPFFVNFILKFYYYFFLQFFFFLLIYPPQITQVITHSFILASKKKGLISNKKKYLQTHIETINYIQKKTLKLRRSPPLQITEIHTSINCQNLLLKLFWFFTQSSDS